MRDKRFFYDEFADTFDETMNRYDLAKRMRVIFKELLPEDLQGKRLLDAGCGTGWFSREAARRGATVVSLDLGPRLLKHVQEKCNSANVAGDVLALPFKDDVFDVVISTEVIEHTVDPKGAIRSISRVLKTGGLFILTTPNRAWYFSVLLANALGLRRYAGYENWVGRRRLKEWLAECGCAIEAMKGFHLFPFIFSFTYPVLDYCDRFGAALGPSMLNVAVRARKKKGLAPAC